MSAVGGNGRGVLLSGETWSRLVRNAAAEEQLVRWLSTLAPGERRAFWAGVLLIDGKVTVWKVVESWIALEPVGRTDTVDMRLSCLSCGKPIDYVPQPKGGRPPSYHDECRRMVRLRREADRRAAARECSA